MIIYMIISTWDHPRVPHLTLPYLQLLPNLLIQSPTLTVTAPMAMGIITATKICMEYSCMSWLTLLAPLP